MKIKLDENLPLSLLAELRALGHDVDSVPDEGLAAHPDADVWAAAQREGRFLITQDLDFSDTRAYLPGTHAGLLLVRLRMPGRLALVQHVATIFRAEQVADWHGCVVIATDSKIRIKRPAAQGE